MHNALLTWYESNGRHDLPWRKTDNVYHIYISEVMLQQTQVKRVQDEYYFQFLDKFPTLEALANASIEEVFGMWSGLGYYRRAKNLHESAKQCTPTLPSDIPSLLKLPGIGRYTAHAIASFGYHQKVSVVDTNIARVLIRYYGMQNACEKELWQHADTFLNPNEPTHHNLALMDLGATVCLSKNPACHECPLQSACQGQHAIEFYTKTQKKNYEEKKLSFAICIKDGKIAMQKSSEGMYKEMLTLPSQDEAPQSGFLGTFKHSVTRYRLEVSLYEVHDLAEQKEIIWVPLENVENGAVSSMTKKAFKLFF